MDFEPPTRTTVRVQERYAHDVNGIALVLEHYAHGLRSLKARGWYFILPIDHHVHPHAYGAVNVYDEDQWLADLIFLKMYLSA